MIHLSVKLRVGMVLGINHNFEKYAMKIYTRKHNEKIVGGLSQAL